jgi:hypothetical protein
LAEIRFPKANFSHITSKAGVNKKEFYKGLIDLGGSNIDIECIGELSTRTLSDSVTLFKTLGTL